MESAVEALVSAATPDPYHTELCRLFNLYRLANVNMRYYGCRAEKFESRSRSLLVAAALCSTGALSLLLIPDAPSYPAAILSGIAAIISGTVPYFGLSEKIRDLRNLRFAYSQLFGQIELAITEMKRAGRLLPEHLGYAKMLHEAYTRIESMDELDPDSEMLTREDAKTLQAIPPDYLWTHF
ncbi:MAG TPA: hypothetical protein VN737_04275 [Bryobacteraceae bacterium]|nr:hypothetical protein [Bryobacteraceae bacterium]